MESRPNHPLRVIDGGGNAQVGVPLCRTHHAEADARLRGASATPTLPPAA